MASSGRIAVIGLGSACIVAAAAVAVVSPPWSDDGIEQEQVIQINIAGSQPRQVALPPPNANTPAPTAVTPATPPAEAPPVAAAPPAASPRPAMTVRRRRRPRPRAPAVVREAQPPVAQPVPKPEPPVAVAVEPPPPPPPPPKPKPKPRPVVKNPARVAPKAPSIGLLPDRAKPAIGVVEENKDKENK